MKIVISGGLGFLALMLALAGSAPVSAHSLDRLEKMLLKRERYVQIVNEKAPEFALKDANGNKVRLSNFRGKVVILNFVYTNCPDVCPLHSEAIASVQASINLTPMKGLVQFVSITTDPKRDTPEVMKAYAANHGFDPVNWVFLTSGADQPAATRKLAERYGLKFTRQKNDYLLHGVVTLIIDKSGALRAKYHGLKFHKTNMIIHINAFSNDSH